MNGPCKNCSIREINCHSSCNLYQSYRNKLDVINDIKREESEFMAYSFNRKLVMGVARDI